MIDPLGTPIDLPGVIEESIGRARQQLAGAELATVAEYPAHLPTVSGDRGQLTALVACLIREAGVLAAHGELHVRADLLSAGVLSGQPSQLPAVLSEGGPWVHLSIGFSAAEGQEARAAELGAADAGERSWQSAECRQLIEDKGSRFWIEQADSASYRLCLALPIWAAYDVGANVSDLRQAVATRLGPGGDQAHALLLMVEDPDVRQSLAGDLETAGYRVLTVGSGEEVLSVARQEQPSLILLDLVARAPTAFEVAGILKHDRRTRNLPVLFLTSVDDPQGGTSMGTVGFLPRQADTGAVISAVRAVLTSGLNPLSRVLVVEQDERLRNHMVLTIQAQGYRVSEAGTPEEAMALAERATPDVALVNASLAQERDYWLLRALRSTARRAEIYVMSDILDEDEARTAMRRGASGYSETGQLPNLLDRMRKRQRPDD